MAEHSILSWNADGRAQTARWYAAGGTPPPRRVVPADDRMCADIAYRLVCEGTAVLWQGDYHGGRQLLAALGRRIDRRSARRGRRPAAPAGGRATGPADAFHRHRQAQGHRARVLGMLLVPLEPGPRGPAVPLRRAPDVAEAATAAYGPVTEPGAVALRELLGAVGAHEWRRKGVDIPALGARVHPHYGVFSPVRGEYVDLVAEAPLPAKSLAFDVGTGTGVLAAVLARRGVERVVATDTDPRALACARDNVDRLGLADQVEVVEGNLFPPGRAPLVVCNPPWLPAKPTSALEHAVYDPGGGMLHGFLAGLAAHLEPGGEGWLVLSDLAEHLGLRGRGELLAAIEAAGLRVAARHETRPRHRKATDPSDPLHAARAAEVTSLWRLTVAE
ncbi:methyltransferase [Streptomyces sp. CMB-StM0423]|uniref:methyltransferase n=1 Tax=Streptomyces sp. CMB-StM0423 TaxID=2059884 RepID=UPI000C714820|nr:class I SAM-dependent methyltransferase [Streptomyces sp. CMB-StM0423]AUH39769.1 methyltransferase [Streptomyces sp. CMB-StM0423]